MTVREAVAEIFGGGGGGAYNEAAERDRRERDQARNSATAEEIAWDDLDGHREGVLRDSSGRLWMFSLAYQRGDNGPATFTVGPSGHVSWLDPATPYASAVEEEAAERELELERERADKARIAELDKMPLADVTLAAVEGHPLPTLAAAAATIEADRGAVSVEDGRLRVRLRQGGSAPARPFLIDAARLLFLAERDVVAALEAGRPIPDCATTPSGAIIVTDDEGVPMERTVEEIDALIGAVEESPWLAPFLEAGDRDIAAVRKRFETGQRNYTFRRSVPERARHGELSTTALVTHPTRR